MRRRKLTILTILSVSVLTLATVLNISTSHSFGVPATGCEHKHVNHYEKRENDFIHNGISEYWCCCDCHKSFKNSELTEVFENTPDPTSSEDSRFIPALGYSASINPSNGTVSTEAKPSSSAFDKVYEYNGTCNSLIKENVFIGNAKKITFDIKATVWFVTTDWGEGHTFDPNIWHTFELTKNYDSTWNISAGKYEQSLTVRRSNIEGYNLKAILDFASDEANILITNLRYIRDKDELIASSLINGASDVSSTVGAPVGFSKVYMKGGYQNDDQGKTFLEKVDIHQYKNVSFAMLTKNRNFYNKDYSVGLSTDKWYLVNITQNSDGTYTNEVRDSSNLYKFGYANINSFTETLKYYNSGGDLNMEIYVTDLYGVLRNDMPTPSGTVIDACAISGNNAPIKESNLLAPVGFSSVHEISQTEYLHGMFFSATPLTNYEIVKFAIKTIGYFAFRSWENSDGSHEWLFFTLKNNHDETFNLTVKTANNRVVETQNNMQSYKGSDPGSYTNYALNSIFYGVPEKVNYPSKQIDPNYDLIIYATEMRAYKEEIVTSPIINPSKTGKNVDNSYKLIYEDNGDKNIKKVADDIQYIFGKATSWNIYLVPKASATESFSGSSKVISIGNTSFYKGSGVSFENPNADSYMVKTVGNSILINATYTNGFIPASYYFLEKTVGFKTYSIGDDVYYDSLTSIPLLSFNSQITPTISMRDIVTHSDNMAGGEKNALGFTFDCNDPYTLTSDPHSLTNQFLNYDKYKTSHPNWYCDSTHDQLCYSAHGIASEYTAMKNQLVEEIKPLIINNFTSDPSQTMAYVYLCISDNWNYCNCNACQAEFATYGSYAGQQMHFVSEIADMIESWMSTNYPGRVIKFPMLSYQQCQDPGIVSGYTLNKNVIIYFAPVKADFSIGFSSTENTEYYNQLVGWSNLLHNNGLYDNLWVWAYSTPANCYLLPSSDFDIVSSQYKTFASFGVRRVMVESIYSTHTSAFEDLNVYLKGRLMLWADYDFDELVTDFMAHYYDSAATNIKKYYDLLTGVIKTNKVKGSIWDTADNKDYWSVDNLKTMLTYLSDALTDADSISDADRKTLVKGRINRERCSVLYMILSYYPKAYKWSKTELTSFIDDFETYTTQFGITKVSYKETTATRIESFRKSIKYLVS